MPEPTETVEAQEPTQAVEQPTPQEEQPFDAERAKALIDKLRNEIKDLKSKAKKADELSEAEQKRKEAEMTEVDRLNKQLADAQAELKAARIATLQRDAATKHNLPAELASRLKGETPEELEADAKALAELLPKPKTPPLKPTYPGNNASGESETYEEKRRRLLG
jgi:cytochrome c556